MSNRKELLKNWRELSANDLQSQLQELTKQQFKLKMQHATGDLKVTHNVKNTRRNIARVLTVLTEKIN